MKKVKHLIANTNNVILGVGALAGAIVAVYGLVQLFQPAPPPPGLLAGIEDVTLIPNIGLAEYEAREQSAQVSVGARAIALPGGYRLAAYTTATGATSSPGPAEPDTTTSTSTSPPEPNTQSTPEPTPTPTTPTTRKPIPRKSGTRTKKNSTGPQGAHRSAHGHSGSGRHEGAGHEGATSHEGTVHESPPEGSSGSVGVPFVKPPAPEMSFKSEGHAQTLTGTGASTKEVEGVLAAATGNTTPTTKGSPVAGEPGGYGETPTTPTTGVSPSKETATPTSATSAKLALPKHCTASCPLAPTIDQIIADSSSPAENARKLVTVFTHSRGRYIDHELHPLGADVEYTLKLTGFVGNDAILEWSLWSESTGEPLPNSWWQRVIVKQVKPSRYEETISGTFWAPIPPKRGDYAFHLVVYDEHGNRRGHAETPVFH